MKFKTLFSNGSKIKYLASKNIIIKPFINNISRIYSASDLVVSRAGALAITELCYMKKAMILIPFKFAANNHQKLNILEAPRCDPVFVHNCVKNALKFHARATRALTNSNKTNS